MTQDASQTTPLLRLRYALATASEAPPGRDADAQTRLFDLDADFERDGAWSGVRELVETAFLELERAGEAALLRRHGYELHRVLAQHRDRIVVEHACLTDTAQGIERTRNFPLDRAYRLIHGLIDLLLHWRARSADATPWRVVVRAFDRAEHLSTRFFAELARRGADRGGFQVLVDALPTRAGTAWAQYRILAEASGLTADGLGLPPLPRPPADPARIQALERTLASHDILEWEAHYPELLRHYRALGDDARCARIAINALCICNHYGYYHESASFADAVLPHLDALTGDSQRLRWDYIGNIFQGLATTGRDREALEVVLAHAEPKLDDIALRAKMHYLLAMAYLRYLRTPDLAAAERHILAAIDAIDRAQAELAPADHAFLKVFIDNGLAFLRVRQGRHREAAELCQRGYALLTRALGEEGHRLHRSVLQYNTAQVYTMLGQMQESVLHYRKSIEMDPYYSEYYNELGNLFQRSENYADALAQYALAVAYSAPYPEVHFNQGMCHLHRGETDAALACLNRSLELDPHQNEALLVRAETLEALERNDLALADYDTVLRLTPDLVTARVNRAVLHYGAGRYAQALADMDRAVALEPGESAHYLNRAEIHKAMAQDALYRRDLRAAEACAA